MEVATAFPPDTQGIKRSVSNFSRRLESILQLVPEQAGGGSFYIQQADFADESDDGLCLCAAKPKPVHCLFPFPFLSFPSASALLQLQYIRHATMEATVLVPEPLELVLDRYSAYSKQYFRTSAAPLVPAPLFVLAPLHYSH